MLSDLLPANSTEWERLMANSVEFGDDIENATGAIKALKMVSPPSSLLPFLAYEYGLSSLQPYVPNLFELLEQGIDWQRLRGTPAALALGLGWISEAADVEEEAVSRKFWNLFQLHLDKVVPDSVQLGRIEGITNLSRPLRSKFWRGYRGLDIRPMTPSESHWSEAHYGEYSGVRLNENGALWSFGREYEYAITPTEAELTALGVWIAPAGEITSLGWGDFSWADANASWADDGEEVRGRLMTLGMLGRMTHVELRDAADQVIGYRRFKSRQFVEFDGAGDVEFDGIKYRYSNVPTRKILFEAMTDFGDAADKVAASANIVFDGLPMAGQPQGKRFLLPDQIEGHISPLAAQPIDIVFAPTVREKVRFLLTV